MKNKLPELKKPYVSLTNESKTHDLAYWRDKIGTGIPEMNLPYDFPKKKTREFETGVYTFPVPDSLFKKARLLAFDTDVSQAVIWIAALKILIYRYCGAGDITVGAEFSEKQLLKQEPEPGIAADFSILQTRLLGSMSFKDVLQETAKIIQETDAHRSISFNELSSALGINNGTETVPFLQIMMHLLTSESLSKKQLRPDSRQAGTIIQADLDITISEQATGLLCSFLYNKTLFKEDTITRMAGHFKNLLEGAVADPTTQVDLLPLLTQEERHTLLVDWNRSAAAYPRNSSIPELFEQQVKSSPDHVALIIEGRETTYLELDKRANQIANYLKNLGIEKEQLVAVCLKKSIDLIASFLGVLKAGGAYVPCDLGYPKERISYMLEDSGAAFVITTGHIINELPPVESRVICLDREEQAIAVQPETGVFHSNPKSLAYVMYTSGSTGKPKGVAIEQLGIIRLVKNASYAKLGPEEIFLNRAPIAFDVSVFEIYASLLNGGKLVLMSSQKPAFEEIAVAIKANQVTTLRVTPDILNVLLENYCEYLDSLRQVFSGGESLPVWLVHKFFNKLKNCRLINAYGPTENSVNTTVYHVKEVDPDSFSIPIGRPISDDAVYILDKHLQPLPIGVAGELYLAGEGVARGYWNKEELTTTSFPADPFSKVPGKRLYKSGDLARYRSDGNIEFLSRIDHQVKIRGCRIELGEVETVIGLFPGVRQSVAGTIKQKEGTSELVSYIVKDPDADFSQQNLRSYTREKLPDYMVPTFFVELEEFPVTPTGKIDRNSLPEPNQQTPEKETTLPQDPIEEELVRLWESLLEIGPIGTNDNFFELGGNSLLAMQMFSEIKKIFNKSLPVSVIFKEDTVKSLGKLISSSEQAPDLSSSIVPIQPKGSKLPVFCIHGGGGEVLIYGELAHALGDDQPLYGLRYTEDNISEVSVESLAEKYIKDIKSVQPSGPYKIVGFCFGGAIAYEIAQMLIEQDHEVPLLAILNFGNPHIHPVEIKQELSYSYLIKSNLKQLSRKPVKQQALFLVQKAKNAYRLVRSKPVSASTGNTTEISARYIIKKAIAAYNPKPYPGKILVVRADKDGESTDAFGWQTRPGGEIEVHTISAEHHTLLKRPHSEAVVACLNPYL